MLNCFDFHLIPETERKYTGKWARSTQSGLTDLLGNRAAVRCSHTITRSAACCLHKYLSFIGSLPLLWMRLFPPSLSSLYFNILKFLLSSAAKKKVLDNKVLKCSWMIFLCNNVSDRLKASGKVLKLSIWTCTKWHWEMQKLTALFYVFCL